MKATTIGVDLAKNVFQVHGVDERGKVVLRKQLRREQLSVFFARLAPCLIGMEACSSAVTLEKWTVAFFYIPLLPVFWFLAAQVDRRASRDKPGACRRFKSLRIG